MHNGFAGKLTLLICAFWLCLISFPDQPHVTTRCCVPAVLAVDPHSDPHTDIRVAEHFQQHGSLGYGADWSHGPQPFGKSLVATCSFYDRQLHLWTPQTAAKKPATEQVPNSY